MIGRLKSIYTHFIDFAYSLESVFLLVIRLIWGYLFFKSGMGKIGNLDSIASYFSSLGIPFPEVAAPLAAYTEVIGGICLMAGFATRLVSLFLIVLMMVAFSTAHSDALRTMLLDPTSIFKESPFTFLFVALITFIFGAGKYSFDQFIGSFGKSKK